MRNFSRGDWGKMNATLRAPARHLENGCRHLAALIEPSDDDEVVSHDERVAIARKPVFEDELYDE